jgi:hypothetical protein
MVNKIFLDGQLDECELTLKDLHEIAKSFNMTLSGIFHHRIEYPESTPRIVAARERESSIETAESASKKGKNGDTATVPPGSPRLEKKGDQGEVREGLKRLGLS